MRLHVLYYGRDDYPRDMIFPLEHEPDLDDKNVRQQFLDRCPFVRSYEVFFVLEDDIDRPTVFNCIGKEVVSAFEFVE